MIETYKDFKKYVAIAIILILFIFMVRYLWPHVNGFLGAFILFALFLPLHLFLTKKLNLNKNLSAILIIIITLLIVIIPSYFIVTESYNQVKQITLEKNKIITEISKFEENFPGLEISDKVNEYLPSFANWSADVLFKSINNVIKTIITLIIMYFILFYLLVYNSELYKILREYLPFNSKNSILLAKEFKKVTYATLISTGLVAIFQGLLLGLGFWALNIKGAVFWGFLAAILSFLPVLGIPLIWVPYGVVYLIKHDYFTAIAILVLGLIINYSEFFIRPYLQKRIGDLHPLISIIGIFIGIPAFGFVGIVIGPLIISYFVLIFRMFKDEYL